MSTSSISLQNVLADALALPSEQYKSMDGMDTTSRDLKHLLGVLEDQITVRRRGSGVSSNNDDGSSDVEHVYLREPSLDSPSFKGSSPKVSMMSPIIGEKYSLKQEDASSQLLPLATAIEAGDAAGKLLAAMMEKKSSAAATKHGRSRHVMK